MLSFARADGRSARVAGSARRVRPAFAASVTLAAALLPGAGQAQDDEVELSWRTYAQFTAESLDSDSGIDFGADRIRASATARYRKLTGFMQIDLGASNLGDDRPGVFANVVTDLYVQYAIDDRNRIRAGQYKTPLGMDWNIPAASLDITKRGMEAGLILQRDIGVMLSGRDFGSFGYDVGVFNIAGRSPATNYLESQEGDENAFAARGHYDAGRWHAELAIGETGAAGGPGTADYEVADLGIRYQGDGWLAKLEWIDGSNVLGDPNRDEQVWYVHGAYSLSENLELVARHYAGESSLGTATTDLSNTYVGVTWWAHRSDRMTGRLQVNYVLAGGDELSYTGIRGYREDGLLVQFQFLVTN